MSVSTDIYKNKINWANSVKGSRINIQNKLMIKLIKNEFGDTSVKCSQKVHAEAKAVWWEVCTENADVEKCNIKKKDLISKMKNRKIFKDWTVTYTKKSQNTFRWHYKQADINDSVSKEKNSSCRKQKSYYHI